MKQKLYLIKMQQLNEMKWCFKEPTIIYQQALLFHNTISFVSTHKCKSPNSDIQITVKPIKNFL